MKIAAYCRVSTDREDQLSSLNHQREFFIAYARRFGHELVKLYADEGISGTSLKKREAFKQLLRDAQKGLFQAVVVKDVSRFARNTVDALQSVRMLKALGINTVFLNADMDSMGDSEFVLTLFSAMAQEESYNLSKRVKWGKRINAEKGRVPPRVFGYDRVDNYTLRVNPEEARIVRRIFFLYTHSGMGCRTISMTLNADGEKTKFGCDWNARGVRRVLTNPLYCGKLVNHKYETESFLTGHQVKLPQQAHFCHSRPDWAIITPEEFERAQETLNARKRPDSPAPALPQGRYSGRHLFSTLIKCEHCGRSFTRKTYTYRNTRVYWRCSTNDQYTARCCDNRTCVEEADLIARLQSYFQGIIGDEEAFCRGVLSGLPDSVSEKEDADALRCRLENQRQKLLAKQTRYQELYAGGLMEMEALRQRLESIRKAQQAIDAQLPPPEETVPGDSLLPQIHRFLRLETMTNAELRRIVDHIRVNRDGQVRIVFRRLSDDAGESPLPSA